MNSLFMNWFGLTVPILQAPIAGAATVELATAVGRAGALGSLALSWPEAQAGLRDATELKTRKIPFFTNFVLRFPNEALPLIIALGVPAVTFSWGVDEALVARVKASGAKVGVQVGSKAGAQTALKAGADFIIVQGMEAGGHVQSSTPLQKLLAGVVAIAGAVPVIAAGGIADARGAAAAMRQGAQGVMMGTRFLATQESGAHELYKQALVKATAGDTSLTNCFDIGWPYAMHRVLRNSTFEMWEAAGSPAAPNRPGEGDVVASSGPTQLLRYFDSSPPQDATGDVLAACLYAGTGVDHINAVEPAGALVTRLWTETQKLL